MAITDTPQAEQEGIWDGYAPEARGMRAALPHVDLFAPAHSLTSLAALEPYLARL